MRAQLDQLAVIEHSNPIGVVHGREAVRNHHARAALHQSFERFLPPTERGNWKSVVTTILSELARASATHMRLGTPLRVVHNVSL